MYLSSFKNLSKSVQLSSVAQLCLTLFLCVSDSLRAFKINKFVIMYIALRNCDTTAINDMPDKLSTRINSFPESQFNNISSTDGQ